MAAREAGPGTLLRRRPPPRWRGARAFAARSPGVTRPLPPAARPLAARHPLGRRELPPPRPGDLLQGLAAGGDIAIALRRNGSWTVSGDPLDVTTLPRDLLALAASGTAARQRILSGGHPVLAVATPVDQGVYVEVASLSGLDATLRFLSALLATGVGVSALLGLGLGNWAGRRALRPLTELRDAAARVASGDLDARLPELDDADLAPLAAAFNRTAEDLQRRGRRDAPVAGGGGHQLRPPLTTPVNAGAVPRRRRAALSPPARPAPHPLDARVPRLRPKVVDPPENSRADRVDDPDLEVCDVADVVTHAVGTRNGVTVDVVGTPPLVLADRRRLDRVVENLLDNAAHHAGGAVHVEVSPCRGGVAVTVDDAGPGIPPDMREEVFERFSRGSGAGRRGDSGGTGLGLALVARHVRAHHGTVRIDDSPYGGARVVVEIPGGAT